MLSRHQRWGLHATAAVTLAGVAVLATSAAGNAAAGTRPESYGGDAAASSFHYTVDRNPAAVPAVEDAFHAEVPFAQSSLDSSGGAFARATTVFPGDGPLGVPALICVFSAQFCNAVPGYPPAYPLMASAQYPSQPDSTAQLSPKPLTSGPFTLTPHSVTAHADPNRVASTTITAGTAFAGVVSAQSATSRTDQHFEGATLVVTAESLLGGVDIGGGALHIDAIRSLATARVDGGKVSAATAQTTVTGATVAGQPVSIDSTGVHVAGNGDNGAVTKQVNAALAQLAARGISLRSLDATKLVKHGVAKASTGGLLLGFDENVNLPVSLPALPVQPPGLNGDYFGSVALAGAGVDAFASPAVPLGGVTAPLPQVSAPGATGGAPSAGGGPLPAAPTTTTTGPTGPAPTVVAPARHNAALLGVDVTNKRLETLALVLLAYPLALLLGRPLRAPSRLPGGE